MRSTRTRSRPARSRDPLPYLIGAGIVLWLGVFGAALFWGDGFGGASSVASSPDRGAGRTGPFVAGGGAGSSGITGADPGRASSDPEAPAAEPVTEEPPEDEDYAEVDRSREEESSGTRLPRAASGGEDPFYDPLDTGAGAETLSETDLSRARLAAFRFMDAAYDFKGSGPADRLLYLEGVNRTVDAPEFWKSPESPGSDPAELIADRTAEYGVENRAVFGDFEVEETSSERVIGTVTFTFDEGDGMEGYEQRVVLSRWAAVWRVLYAKPLEEV